MTPRSIVFWSVLLLVTCSAVSASADPFVINEVVHSPRQDWNDGTPFDSTPGATLPADADDEYIELLNVSVTPQDLTDYYLEMADGSDIYDCFGFNAITPPGACADAQVYLVFDSSGALSGSLTAVPAGGYVVIGNPAGSMGASVTVTLVDNTSATIDVATAPYGSNYAGNESSSRLPDGVDSDDDEADFTPRSGTPGSSNGGLCTLVAGDVVVNEVSSDPQQDWGDDGGGGTPFDATPGTGTANADDEFVELENTSGAVLDLSGCLLDMVDGNREKLLFTTVMAAADPHVRVYDAGGTLSGTIDAVPIGGFVLVGDPPGSMDDNTTVALVDSAGDVDVVDVAGGSLSAIDESISRFPDAIDTNVDEDDLAPKLATPGSNNGSLCALQAGDVVVNEVVSVPQQDWNHDEAGTAFNGTAGSGTVGVNDELIELKNTSGGVLDLTSCVLDMVDSSREKLVFSTVDATAATWVRVFDAAGTQQGTANLINAVPIGGYVLVGDPPGSMLNGITVELVDDAGAVDTVSVNAGAAGVFDEAAARFPDGADTGVDADDFFNKAATPGASNGQLCTLAMGDAVVNEVVSVPQQDWSAGGTSAFDGAPGAGVVGSGDEYVELKNSSGAALDLSHCVLTLADGTDEKLLLQAIDAPAAPYVRVFDSAGTLQGNAAQLADVPTGGYVLIGDPPGTMNNSVTVALLDDAGTQDATAVNAGASSLIDESASRFPDGTDTDVDADDISGLRATPGASNGQYCPLTAGDAVINELITDAQQDWNHDGAGTAFDGTAMAGTVDADDELIELKNTSGAAASFEGCRIVFEDSSATEMVLQTLDAVADPYVRVFDSTGTQVGTATMLDDVPAGGYVLIGDPPGTLNNSVVVTLSGSAALDVVDFGADAPSLGSNDNEDEAGARLPDGADTDVGADDFKQQRATPGANNELDECTLGLDDCAAIATCTDTAAGYDCTCPMGYIGTGQICTDANECQVGSHDCDPNATCTNTDGGFTCACDEGFTGDGKTCTDVDECAGGDDDCDENATCENTPGSFACDCNAGFEGDGLTCDDNNECVLGTDDCDTNAVCTNTPGSYECACNTGFEGDGVTCTSTGSNTDDPADDEGCSCSVGPRPRPSSNLTWLLALGGLWLWRRRD